MSNYDDNDDDLFDYDPDSDQIPKNETTTATVDNDFVSSVKDEFDNIADEENDDINRNKLAIAFNISTQKFVESTNKDAYNKSIRVILDKLSNGEFTLLNLFYRLEMRIDRRISFLNLFSELSQDNFEENSLVKEVLKLLSTSFTELYISTCYKTTYNIALYTLSIERALYKSLSRRLGIPVRQELFVNPADETNIDVSLSEFEHNVLLNVYRSLMDNELSEELAAMFSRNVSFIDYEK